jgi:hypothetical protein
MLCVSTQNAPAAVPSVVGVVLLLCAHLTDAQMVMLRTATETVLVCDSLYLTQ